MESSLTFLAWQDRDVNYNVLTDRVPANRLMSTTQMPPHYKENEMLLTKSRAITPTASKAHWGDLDIREPIKPAMEDLIMPELCLSQTYTYE